MHCVQINFTFFPIGQNRHKNSVQVHEIIELCEIKSSAGTSAKIML